ncbi:MAG TPA: hypothetical protein VLJ41_07460 [Segetibacter sp.]|nr:hypothetical protein [Segetibacter sp.]
MNNDKNKGLADTNDGEFILNESGTSVSIDAEGEFSEDKAIAEADKEVNESFIKKPENLEKKD